MLEEASLDIVHNILSRLPATALLRLRCVCEAWKTIIDDPGFAKYHFKNQHSSSSTILTRNRQGGALFGLCLDSLDYDRGYQKFNVIPLKQIIRRGVPRLSDLPAPSCNGLILISHNNDNKSWVIWNPLLQHYHLLPPAPSLWYGYELATCGLGHDGRSDDYKVVRVDKYKDHSKTRVYSLKSRSWRTIDFPGGGCLGGRGVFLNGALHWRWRDGGMVVLDLGTEVHRYEAGPPSEGWRWWQSLDALDGCLIWSCNHENRKGVEAWVMEDYGTEKSWAKLFSVETTGARGLRIVGYLKSKGEVFLRHDWGDGGLKWLHLEKKSWRDIKIYGISELSFAQFSPASLVRLDKRKKRRGGTKRKKVEACAWSSETRIF